MPRIDYYDAVPICMIQPDGTHTGYKIFSDENGTAVTLRQDNLWSNIWRDVYGYEYTLTDNASMQMKADGDDQKSEHALIFAHK